jgi:SET family sugar efflux transporter-like MFS transporter
MTQQIRSGLSALTDTSVLRRLAGLMAGGFLLGLASSLVVPFLSLWGTRAIGMTPFVFGMFMTSTALSAMVASTLLARWSDTRAPRRTVLLLSSAGGALGYLGYASVSDPLALALIGALLLGVASANFPQLFAHAREELARPEYSGFDTSFAMSLLRAAFALAWTVGPALGAMVVQRFGYRGSFLSASGIFCLYGAVVWGSVPSRAIVTAGVRAKASLAKLLTRPVLLANFAAFALIFAGLSLNLMNLPLLLTNELGGDESHVGTAFAIGPIAEMPLMLWFGRLGARGHQAKVIRLGVLLGVAYFVGLMLVGAPSHVYPLQLLNAAAVAVTMSVAIPYFQDLLPGQTGVATSVYASTYSLGSLLGYFGFGVLVPSIGHRGIVLLCAALGGLSLTVLMLEATIGRRRFAEPRPARPAEDDR